MTTAISSYVPCISDSILGTPTPKIQIFCGTIAGPCQNTNDFYLANQQLLMDAGLGEFSPHDFDWDQFKSPIKQTETNKKTTSLERQARSD